MGTVKSTGNAFYTVKIAGRFPMIYCITLSELNVKGEDSGKSKKARPPNSITC